MLSGRVICDWRTIQCAWIGTYGGDSWPPITAHQKTHRLIPEFALALRYVTKGVHVYFKEMARLGDCDPAP
jgi:hypothetical protein